MDEKMNKRIVNGKNAELISQEEVEEVKMEEEEVSDQTPVDMQMEVDEDAAKEENPPASASGAAARSGGKTKKSGKKGITFDLFVSTARPGSQSLVARPSIASPPSRPQTRSITAAAAAAGRAAGEEEKMETAEAEWTLVTHSRKTPPARSTIQATLPAAAKPARTASGSLSQKPAALTTKQQKAKKAGAQRPTRDAPAIIESSRCIRKQKKAAENKQHMKKREVEQPSPPPTTRSVSMRTAKAVTVVEEEEEAKPTRLFKKAGSHKHYKAPVITEVPAPAATTTRTRKRKPSVYEFTPFSMALKRRPTADASALPPAAQILKHDDPIGNKPIETVRSRSRSTTRRIRSPKNSQMTVTPIEAQPDQAAIESAFPTLRRSSRIQGRAAMDHLEKEHDKLASVADLMDALSRNQRPVRVNMARIRRLSEDSDSDEGDNAHQRDVRPSRLDTVVTPPSSSAVAVSASARQQQQVQPSASTTTTTSSPGFFTRFFSRFNPVPAILSTITRSFSPHRALAIAPPAADEEEEEGDSREDSPPLFVAPRRPALTEEELREQQKASSLKRWEEKQETLRAAAAAAADQDERTPETRPMDDDDDDDEEMGDGVYNEYGGGDLGGLDEDDVNFDTDFGTMGAHGCPRCPLLEQELEEKEERIKELEEYMDDLTADLDEKNKMNDDKDVQIAALELRIAALEANLGAADAVVVGSVKPSTRQLKRRRANVACKIARIRTPMKRPSVSHKKLPSSLVKNLQSISSTVQWARRRYSTVEVHVNSALNDTFVKNNRCASETVLSTSNLFAMKFQRIEKLQYQLYKGVTKAADQHTGQGKVFFRPEWASSIATIKELATGCASLEAVVLTLLL